MAFRELLIAFIVILISAKTLGELMERIKQPAVLGELLAGVLVGTSVLGWVKPEHTLELLAEIGIVLLLFEIGLETDLKEMLRVGRDSLMVAVAGVAVPFLLGYFAMILMGGSNLVAVFVGATLTATSIGITAKVLSDLRKLGTVEAKIIIGAAVADDILGLVILALVASLAEAGTVSLTTIVAALMKGVGFLVAAILIGNLLVHPLIRIVDLMRGRGILFLGALIFALTLAYLADLAGSAFIIGAFAAGITLARTDRKKIIEERLQPVVDVFAPIFFVMVGIQVNISILNPLNPTNIPILIIALVITVMAVVGKLVSGYVIPKRRANRLAIGIGMMPRGEVGLIFAQLGRATGLFSHEIFSALVVVVMVTTFLAPPLLKVVLGR